MVQDYLANSSAVVTWKVFFTKCNQSSMSAFCFFGSGPPLPEPPSPLHKTSRRRSENVLDPQSIGSTRGSATRFRMVIRTASRTRDAEAAIPLARLASSGLVAACVTGCSGGRSPHAVGEAFFGAVDRFFDRVFEHLGVLHVVFLFQLS